MGTRHPCFKGAARCSDIQLGSLLGFFSVKNTFFKKFHCSNTCICPPSPIFVENMLCVFLS